MLRYSKAYLEIKFWLETRHQIYTNFNPKN